jgi:hypothetical protein
VILRPDDADGKVCPNEDECCNDRNADGGSVGDIPCHPCCHFVGAASAEQYGGHDREIGSVLHGYSQSKSTD